VGGLGKLAHCHPAMLMVFLQALSDVCVDGALAIHGHHPPNAKKSASPALAARLNAQADNCVVICGGRLERIMLDRCKTVFTLQPLACAGLGDCRPVPAMTVCRARSDSRFTVAQLNFS
jgi:hypothetical protein